MNNFNIKEFTLKAEAGERYDLNEVLNCIKSFRHIVLWGAAALGEAIGAFLLQNGIDFDEYWDLKAESLVSLNGKKVTQPFSGAYDKDVTLVMLCIANNVIYYALRRQLKEEGFTNNLFGAYIYMALICPSDIKNGLDIDYCLHKSPCLKIFCPRLVNVFNNSYIDESKEYQILRNSATVIVNQMCNLSCKYCTSYMHSYKPKDRVNFATKNIVRDIDNFLTSIDSVGSFTVMGGEPFLHPDISIIIKALLKHKNFGFLSIATNGVCVIKPEQLEGLEDPRVVVSFNDYLPALPERMKEIFDTNIKLAAQSGVFYTVGRYMSEWAIPSTLYELEPSLEAKAQRKKRCDYLHKYLRCHQLKNGKLHPCDFANSVYSLGVADYKTDYVDLSNKTNLHKRLYEHYNASYYNVCGHCRGSSLGTVKGAALQGKLDFVNLPEKAEPSKYIPL